MVECGYSTDKCFVEGPSAICPFVVNGPLLARRNAGVAITSTIIAHDAVTRIQVDDVTEKREYTDDYQDKTLYIPGPTEVREDVIAEMCQPMFGHRMDRMTDLYTTIVEDTKEFLGTDNDVIVLTASGRRSGSRRRSTWSRTASSCRPPARSASGRPTSPNASARTSTASSTTGARRSSPTTSATRWNPATMTTSVAVMNESSTGVRNPIEEIGDVVAEYPDTYFVVDAVSALGGDYVDIDEHSIDVIFASSQKAFAMPPGLAICTVSDEAYERELSKDSASWYGGFQRALDYYDRKGQTHSTPAIPIMLAYRKQMKHMLDEGHEGRDKRHREMAEYTREWAYEHFDMFPEEGYESQTVACIENTQGIDVAATIEGQRGVRHGVLERLRPRSGRRRSASATWANTTWSPSRR